MVRGHRSGHLERTIKARIVELREAYPDTNDVYANGEIGGLEWVLRALEGKEL